MPATHTKVHHHPDTIHEVQRILTGLGLAVTATADGWQATAPAWRFDIEREEDLVEEVGRVNAYDKVPAAQSPARAAPLASPEVRPTVQRLRQVLVDRGFDEAITYSFVDPVLQKRVLGPGSGRASSTRSAPTWPSSAPRR